MEDSGPVLTEAGIASLVGQMKELREQMHLLGRNRNVMVGTLLSERLELRSPLPVLLEYDGHQHVASSADLNIYGSGESESEALDDFRRAVEDFYVNLGNENLGPDLKRRFDYLASIIREK